MANYPTSLDNFTNPTAVDSLSAPSHSLQHADANDAIEALETKLGLSASPAGSATAGHVLVAGTGGTTSWTTVAAGAISTTGGTAGQYLSAGTAGVATWASVPDAGLTLIKTQTIGSAVSSVEVTGAFSATYDAYKIIISSGLGSATDSLKLQLGASVTGYYYTYIGPAGNGNGTNQASFIDAGTFTPSAIYFNVDLVNPFLAKYTGMIGYQTSDGASGYYINGAHRVATSYTAFTLAPKTGTITGGTIYVYGYKI